MASAQNQQTVQAMIETIENALFALRANDQVQADERERGRAALRDLAAQASQAQEWKQLATDLGDALRQIEHLVNHEYRLKHHDLAFVFNTVTQVMDVGEVSALLARLHDLAAEQDAA